MTAAYSGLVLATMRSPWTEPQRSSVKIANSPQPASANAEVARFRNNTSQNILSFFSWASALSVGSAARTSLLFGIASVSLLAGGSAQDTPGHPTSFRKAAPTQLATSLAQAQAHASHVWRDTAPTNTDGTVDAYIEIARGDRNKWEFRMDANARAVNRVMPATLGGYPVNYGFVPQTVSYDGDPFDALVLGPALPGGRLVRGVIVGLMEMEDEKGLDSKVVLSLTDADGRPRHRLTAGDRQRIEEYFRRYKLHEPGKFSRVPGWGSMAQGLSYVQTTHVFFLACRQRAGAPCRVATPAEPPRSIPPPTAGRRGEGRGGFTCHTVFVGGQWMHWRTEVCTAHVHGGSSFIRSLVVVLAFALPSAAAADTYLTPYFGSTFTAKYGSAEPASKFVYGGDLMWLGTSGPGF